MFGKLINPSYPKYAIGFEQGSLTALGLQKSGRNAFSIKQVATVSISELALRPSFTETNVLDIDELLVSLNEVVTQAGLQRQKKWSVSLPSNSARVAIITLENNPTSKQELNEVIKWKVERSFGAGTDEIRYSLEKLPLGDNGKPRYLATAVKYSVLDEFEAVFDALGWHVGLILPRQLSETQWLTEKKNFGDSLLISSQNEGFNAIVLRQAEPAVVRAVTCSPAERDDEIFRLLMFYRDRFEKTGEQTSLERVLVVSNDINLSRLREIASEALGRTLQILNPQDVGLEIPVSNLSFYELAAPAGLASLSWS